MQHGELAGIGILAAAIEAHHRIGRCQQLLGALLDPLGQLVDLLGMLDDLGERRMLDLLELVVGLGHFVEGGLPTLAGRRHRLFDFGVVGAKDDRRRAMLVSI